MQQLTAPWGAADMEGDAVRNTRIVTNAARQTRSLLVHGAVSYYHLIMCPTLLNLYAQPYIIHVGQR